MRIAPDYLQDRNGFDDEEEQDTSLAAPGAPSPVSFSGSVGTAAHDSPSTPDSGLNYTPVSNSMRQAAAVIPEPRRIFGAPAPAVGAAPIASAQPDPAKGYTDALSRRNQVLSEKPLPPKPKWWRLAVGAVRGLSTMASNQQSKEAVWWNRVQVANAEVEGGKEALDTGNTQNRNVSTLEYAPPQG